MRKTLTVVLDVMTVLCLCVGAWAGSQGTFKGEDKFMGYCFDAALDEKADRLYVAGGQAGSHVFAVREGDLQFITTVHEKGYHRNLKIAGDRLFLADARRGLVVYAISGDVPTETWAQEAEPGMGLHVEGQRVYLAWGKHGLAIFDITDADAPTLIGHCESLDDAWDVWVSGRYAYVADVEKGVVTVDVSDPSAPRRISRVTWDPEKPMAEIIRGEGSAAFVGAGKHGLIALDLADPSRPLVAGRFRPSEGSFGEGLCVRDGLVYLANGHNGNRDDNALIIVDGRTPERLEELGRCSFLGWVEGVCVAGDYAFVTNTWSGVRCINVAEPTRPVQQDTFGPIMEAHYDPHLDTPVGAEEERQLDEFSARKKEIFEGTAFRDQSTPIRALLTMIWAFKSGDLDLYVQVNPQDGARRDPQQFQQQAAKTLAEWEKADVLRISRHDAEGDTPAACAVYVRENGQDAPMDWNAEVFTKENGVWKKLYNTGDDGPIWKRWLSRASRYRSRAIEQDPLLATPMDPEQARAIEEFRRIKARILAGETYEDASTPLRAALTRFSTWDPSGQTRAYFTSLDILRAPLPPDQPEEGSVWPIFAGYKELADTFIVAYSKGQWMWLGNQGNNDDWRPSKSRWEEQARKRIEEMAAAEATGAQSPAEPPTPDGPAGNRVMKLNGTSDFVRVPDSPSLHAFTNAITIEVWFKASSFYRGGGNVNSLVRKDVRAGDEDFLLRFRTVGGEPRVEMSPGYHIGVLQASYPFTPGKWYHLAGTYDGHAMTICVNGAQIRSERASGRMRISRSDLFIGKGDPDFSFGEYFHGALDEVRLWNVARSQRDIQRAMNGALTGAEEGLVAYWNFDDGTAGDLTGHGHDGLLSEGARMVTDVLVSQKEDLPLAYLLDNSGWGRNSSEAIARRYDRTSLDQIADRPRLLRAGFALYDTKRYSDALAVFEKAEERAGADGIARAIALIWQGHTLDLLGRRKEAISRYQAVADMVMGRRTEVRHDQYGLAYSPSPYARQRMSTPFTRVENQDDD